MWFDYWVFPVSQGITLGECAMATKLCMILLLDK